MDLQTVFYSLGIIVLTLLLFFLLGTSILFFVIWRRVSAVTASSRGILSLLFGFFSQGIVSRFLKGLRR